MSSPSSADAVRAGDVPSRRIALLGSTGSIGRQTIDVLAAHPEAFRVVALATGSNATLLGEQAVRFRPAAVALADEPALNGMDLPPGTERVGGADALERLATRDDVDFRRIDTASPSRARSWTPRPSAV